ncbi:hypothetical protein EC973_000610 [Apophysomyces ossiformis]|uniref:Bromo domain-containing protein n=1 Tax=Apophysomyces ossiformis TaxID=679940 RepID=A0A8H7ESV7_9FUNG|nr:hypothetical protein EC973_000610 [Apophysomyces ossiformis]
MLNSSIRMHSCLLQYNLLVQELEAEKEQAKTDPSAQEDLPTVVELAKKLHVRRVQELQKAIRQDEAALMGLVSEIDEIRSGRWDANLANMVPTPTPAEEIPSSTAELPATSEEIPAASVPENKTVAAWMTDTESDNIGPQSVTSVDLLPVSFPQTQDTCETQTLAEMNKDVKDEDEKLITPMENVPLPEPLHSDIAQRPANIATSSTLEKTCQATPIEMNFPVAEISLLGHDKQDSITERTDPLVSTPLSITPADTPRNVETETSLDAEQDITILQEPEDKTKIDQQCIDVNEVEEDSKQAESALKHFEADVAPCPAEKADTPKQFDPIDQGEDPKYGGEDIAGSTYVSPSTTVQSAATSMDIDNFDPIVGGESNAATPTAMTPTSLASSSDRKRTREEQRQKSWQKNVNLLWQEIANHKNGTMFMNPIKESIAPRYYDVVKQPMDLKTIKNRVRDGVIKSTMEFERDIVLMLTNSLMYNKEGTEVYQMAHEMLGDALEQIRLFKAADSYSSANAPARKKPTIR